MLTIRPEQAKDIERIGRLTWQNTGKECEKSWENDTPQEIKGYRRKPAAI